MDNYQIAHNHNKVPPKSTSFPQKNNRKCPLIPMGQLVTAKTIQSQATQAQHKMANSLNFRRPLESHTPEMIKIS